MVDWEADKVVVMEEVEEGEKEGEAVVYTKKYRALLQPLQSFR
jgi:hypothetical protein